MQYDTAITQGYAASGQRPGVCDRQRQGVKNLLTASDWQQLPRSVQQRFNHLFTPGQTVCYIGQALENRMSRAGWWLAQFGRLFGSPLPLVVEPGPVAVTVTDHEGNGGGHWCRIYHRPTGAAQCIQSVKRFCGPTGMEESLGGFLLGMRLAIPLRVSVHKAQATLAALQFQSDGLALYLGSLRVPVPRWLVPVDLLVEHRPLAETRVEFVLLVNNAWFGELLYQRMEFTETRRPPANG